MIDKNINNQTTKLEFCVLALLWCDGNQKEKVEVMIDLLDPKR